jgi:hypothetical protein
MISPKRLALVAVVAVTALAVFGYFNYDVRRSIAVAQGDTAEARVERYLAAVSRGDERAALAAWGVDAGAYRDELEARRSEVTRALASQSPRAYRIEHIEWWSMCCEPHIIASGRLATGARMTVGIGDADYVFDVFAMEREDVYDGLPPHGWVLRDVYPSGAAPIYNTFPGR